MGRHNISGIPPFPPFPGWVEGAPVIPEQYWDVISPEQRYKTIEEWLQKIVDFLNGQTTPQTNQLLREVEALQSEFEKFKESGFFDYYAEQIEKWIADNLIDVMRALLNQGIFFGLTEDGYFCANVLTQLTIYFDTITDYSNSDYGRLVLNY
jgi:hypothetical protein